MLRCCYGCCWSDRVFEDLDTGLQADEAAFTLVSSGNNWWTGTEASIVQATGPRYPMAPLPTLQSRVTFVSLILTFGSDQEATPCCTWYLLYAKPGRRLPLSVQQVRVKTTIITSLQQPLLWHWRRQGIRYDGINASTRLKSLCAARSWHCSSRTLAFFTNCRF